MNKLKTFKYKTTSPENGLLSKISKRYSTVVNSKFIRKSTSPIRNANRRSKSPQKHIITGSYNMSGKLSDDHKTEIGAPVLISKTNIDIDGVDNVGLHVRGPSANTNSSGSENEIFVDAINTFSIVPDIKFEFKPRSSKEASPESQITSSNSNSPATGINGSSSGTVADISSSGPDDNYYETPKCRKSLSKSAQNLHKSELRVFLQKAPSNLEMDLKFTTADLDNCFDLPRRNLDNDDDELPLPPLPLLPSPKLPKHESSLEIQKSLSTPPIVKNKKVLSHSEPNTPMNPDKTEFLNHFKSAESLNKNPSGEIRKSFVFSSSAAVNRTSSRDSVNFNSSIEDFDLKSVSFQSLDAKNLFLSIEELNEITREINASEDFNNEIVDLEYCEHRDALKPNERRITLLKNKNSKLINLDKNKEKLNHAWSGLKHWLGEESGKIKEVVQKHAAMQRVGAIKNIGQDSVGSKLAKSSGQITSGNSSARESMERSDIGSEMLNSYGSSVLSIDRSVSSHTMTGNLKGLRDGNESDAVTIADDNGSVYTNVGNSEISVFTKKPKVKEGLEGQNGFEELRRYIKQGGDFGKDLVGILQERIDSEQIYAKSLTKMATKLSKACRDVPGSIADAWRGVATEMESRSEVHRQLSSSLHEELVKPLKLILENHHKTRKSVETNVDKASRILIEWRVSESKSKKISHTAARENEKLQDAMLDVRIQKSPSIAILQQQQQQLQQQQQQQQQQLQQQQQQKQIGAIKNVAEKEIKSAEKDCAKLDNKRRKAEESVKRADVEYYTLCIRSERARVDWEMSVLRGSLILQSLENQRLSNMKQFVSNYVRLTNDINPIFEGLCQRLLPQIEACNVQKDLSVVKSIRRTAEGPSEQLLPDFYCEHTTLAMNRERRKHALIKLLQLVKTDLERERRSRNGLKGLSQSMNNQDNQNITDKLYHIRSMLTYLEGARFKLQSALLELDHKPRTSHPLAPHIQITRDRTGLQQSILKVPIWLKNNDKMPEDGIICLNDKNSDFDCESQNNNTNCIDIKNEILIKNYNRSKSSTELLINGQQLKSLSQNSHSHQHELCNGKSNTLPTNNPNSPTVFDRGIADGGSNQPDSDFDEFSSEDEDSVRRKSIDKLDGIIIPVGNYKKNIDGLVVANDAGSCGEDCGGSSTSSCSQNGYHLNEQTNIINTNIILSKCKALYSYEPKLYDELELKPGDIIEVHAKQEDGWWLGALNGHVGIFPATYVEEFI